MSDGINYDLDKYVSDKLERLMASEKNLKSIFKLMTDEPEKLFAESNDGYKITRITYGQFKERTEQMAGSLLDVLGNIPKSSLVGIYMNNSEKWLECFWGLLMNGYKPILMNNRMGKSILEDIITQYDVKAVISDGEKLGSNTLMIDDIVKGCETSKKVPSDNDDWADEIVLMSSGTTSHVKLCVYNGETFVYQICDSGRIIKACKEIKAHYKGELKQLTFLPFYHVFGLVAVFMWFGFFNRSFVFLRDFSSETILNTVRRHKVTHIFSIPLLWNTVYETVVRTAKERGEYEKLMKGIKISEKLSGIPFLSKLFTKLAFKSVREQIFGDSIRFLISGGSAISPDVLRFFNAIGYHLANGYGMTEVGITSVELSNKRRELTDKSVGKPFASVEYKISEEGELLVRGETLADIVYEDGKVSDKTENGWFHTNDLACEKDGRYFILGRKDDVIIGLSGENINPDVLEEKIKIDGAEAICITRASAGENKLPVLLVKVSPYASADTLKQIAQNADDCLKELDLQKVISKVILTGTPLMDANDFKLNRKKIGEKIDNGMISAVNPEKDGYAESEITAKVSEIIASVLGKTPEEVKPGSDLFFELGGSSLDYFTIVMELQKEFKVTFPSESEGSFKTAGEFADYIEKHR
ncbi:MAG: AMP-binding protein [Lachnospiraceae bacterium]|nr:AMP-binding protein [Lachnospiraceae bacterium]